jgi:hypothetical protein
MMTPNEFSTKTHQNTQNQVVSDQSINTLSLSKYFQDSIDYRTHSALKIRVKPRQALASVNIKLMEQRPKTSTNKPNVSYALRSSSNNCEDINLDDYYDKALSAMTREELMAGIEHLGVGKDAFRPSTVKRKIKSSTSDDSTIQLANTLNQEKPSSSKAVSFDKNATQVFNDKRILNNLKKMSQQPLDTINIKIRRNKTEMNLAPLRPTSIKNLTNENEIALPATERNDQETLFAPINTPHTPKSRLSLYNNISGIDTKKPRSSLSMRFNTPKSPRSRPSSIQVAGGERHLEKTLPNPSLNKESPNMILDNLNENEFIELLKEYRRTKKINLDCVLTLKSKETTSKASTPSGDFSNAAEEKLKNITKSYTSFDTAHLTDNSNLSKLANNHASLRLPSQSNLSLDSNVNSSVFLTNSNLNNNKFIGDIQVNNIDFTNIKTNTISTANNMINGKRLPSSFANYLNNKILLKNSKSVVGFLIKNNNKENVETRRVTSSDRLNSAYLREENLHENNQNFGRLKILNFPAFAN